MCGSGLNPRPARSVSPVAVSAVRKGLGSDEETGVQRTNAGLDRPRLHADGARVRQARGGRPSDARPLVPDANRGVPAPAAAAVVSAAPTASWSRNRQLTPEFTPVQGQWTRSVNYPVPAIRTAESQRPRATSAYQDHQSSAPVTVTLQRAFLAPLPSDMGQVHAGVPEAVNRARRMIVTRYPDRVLHIAGNMPEVISRGPRCSCRWPSGAAPGAVMQFPARERGSPRPPALMPARMKCLGLAEGISCHRPSADTGKAVLNRRQCRSADWREIAAADRAAALR